MLFETAFLLHSGICSQYSLFRHSCSTAYATIFSMHDKHLSHISSANLATHSETARSPFPQLHMPYKICTRLPFLSSSASPFYLKRTGKSVKIRQSFSTLTHPVTLDYSQPVPGITRSLSPPCVIVVLTAQCHLHLDISFKRKHFHSIRHSA